MKKSDSKGSKDSRKQEQSPKKTEEKPTAEAPTSGDKVGKAGEQEPHIDTSIKDDTQPQLKEQGIERPTDKDAKVEEGQIKTGEPADKNG